MTNMVLEQEVVDSSTSVVLVGWRFLEESIADRTTVATLSRMAWTCSGGRLGWVMWGQVCVCWLR